jgi:hypothetical protein
MQATSLGQRETGEHADWKSADAMTLGIARMNTSACDCVRRMPMRNRCIRSSNDHTRLAHRHSTHVPHPACGALLPAASSWHSMRPKMQSRSLSRSRCDHAVDTKDLVVT